jgi:hypothetical protein
MEFFNYLSPKIVVYSGLNSWPASKGAVMKNGAPENPISAK